MSDRLKVQVTRTKRANATRAEWRYTIIDMSNDEPLARSTEGYYNYDDMLTALKSVTGGVLGETKSGWPMLNPVLVRPGDLPPIVIQGDSPARRR